MQRMYDAIYPYTIPVGSIPAPDFVAGYVDGNWPSLAGMRLRYPAAVPVSITAIPGSAGSATADVCDVENGDYTAAQGGAWAKARFVAGFVPCLYTSESNWPALRAAVAQAGVDPDLVDWWIAGYPGSAGAWQLYPGSVAHQFVDRGPYDESAVVDGWTPGRPLRPPAPVVTPPAPPAPTPEVWMIPTGCTDDGAVRAQIREWWDTYRTDLMSEGDQQVFLNFFHMPPTQQAWGISGYGGSPDLLLAGIVDDARTKGVLRPQFAGAV